MTTPTRRAALILATMLAVACLVALVVILREPQTDPMKQAGAAGTEAQDLVQNKNVALAHLENHDTARSAPVFEELAAALPAEPLGPRNLSVARVLALGEEFERVTPGNRCQRAGGLGPDAQGGRRDGRVALAFGARGCGGSKTSRPPKITC